MLRSAFRGKQAGDTTTKNEKKGRNPHEKSHFFFHRENGEQLDSRLDSREDRQISNENLSMVSTEGGVGYNVSEGELHLDCDHEFLEATQSSGSDKESANEDEGITKRVPATQSGVNAATEEVKDQREGSFSSSERQIYEMQLAQLQEQLFNTMIDYQDMSSQVKKLKAVDVEKLQRELQEEREKNVELKEKLKQKQKSLGSKLHRKNASRIHTKHGHGMAADNSERGGDDWVDLGREEDVTSQPSSSNDASDNAVSGSNSHADEESSYDILDGIHHTNAAGQSQQYPASSSAEEPHRAQTVKTKLEIWKMQVVDLLVDRLWDFVNDEPETADEEDGEGEPLAVKTLKENINRFSAGIKPITSFIKSVHGVLTWSNPTASFLIFLVYMYSVWRGYLLSLVLSVAIGKLFMNYLYAKGIAKQLGFVEKEKDEGNSSEDYSWSDKFQLVLQVARKVQNTLGNMADSLEKIKNLLTWQHPVATRKLFTNLCVALLASLLLKGPTLFLLIGLALGIKLFIVNPIYHRFPKVKRRYDSTAKLWRELPTGAELAARQSEAETYQEGHPRAYSVNALSSPSNSNTSEQSSGPSTNLFSEKFKLPSSETCLPGWEDGKRCALIDKEKPFSNVKHGRLYLTSSYLCFEKARSSSSKHISIKLDTIAFISKAKPIGIMPGTGMALEIQVRGVDKPYIFGAIIGRDDVFESIKATGRAANIPWALV